MSFRISENMIGLPVHSAADGSFIGTVVSMLCGKKEKRFRYFLVRPANGPDFVVPYSDVIQISADRITCLKRLHLLSTDGLDRKDLFCPFRSIAADDAEKVFGIVASADIDPEIGTLQTLYLRQGKSEFPVMADLFKEFSPGGILYIRSISKSSGSNKTKEPDPAQASSGKPSGVLSLTTEPADELFSDDQDGILALLSEESTDLNAAAEPADELFTDSMINEDEEPEAQAAEAMTPKAEASEENEPAEAAKAEAVEGAEEEIAAVAEAAAENEAAVAVAEAPQAEETTAVAEARSAEAMTPKAETSEENEPAEAVEGAEEEIAAVAEAPQAEETTAVAEAQPAEAAASTTAEAADDEGEDEEDDDDFLYIPMSRSLMPELAVDYLMGDHPVIKIISETQEISEEESRALAAAREEAGKSFEAEWKAQTVQTRKRMKGLRAGYQSEKAPLPLGFMAAYFLLAALFLNDELRTFCITAIDSLYYTLVVML